MKGENADAGVQIDDEHKETIGIIYMRIILIYWYVPLVTKRDLVTNIGFHIMKVEIGRDGELIPHNKSGYEHHEKVYITKSLLLHMISTLLDTLSLWRCICNGKC